MDIRFPVSVPILTPGPNQNNATSPPQNGESFENLLARAREAGKISDAARQFEALIAGQVLKAAREASDGGWLGGEDQTGELTLEMAEQGFAQALAKKGALGISKLVTADLLPRQITAASSAPATATPPANTDSPQ